MYVYPIIFLDRLMWVMEVLALSTYDKMNKSSEYSPCSLKLSSISLLNLISRIGISPPWMQTVLMSCSFMNLARYFKLNRFITSACDFWFLFVRKSTFWYFSILGSSTSSGSTGCLNACLSNNGVSNMFFLSCSKSFFTVANLLYRFSGSLWSKCTRMFAISFDAIFLSKKNGTAKTLLLGDSKCKFS